MAIIKKDGFKFLDGLASEYIVIESNRFKDYVEYINKYKIKAIYICNLYYNEKDIEFLKECDFVEKININSETIVNYYGLSYFKNLKVLLLDEPKVKVDLSLNPFIEELAISMNKKIIGINKLEKLKRLRVWKYRPKSKSLMELSMLKSIEELMITQSPIISLKGCGELSKLKKLELNYLSKLEDIHHIGENKDTLKSLRFTACKNIRNHDYVANLEELEVLDFSKCGEIDNIRFVKDMEKLKEFIFMDTNVKDGDLSPCTGLEYVAFLNKKHYSHKSKDFKLDK